MEKGEQKKRNIRLSVEGETGVYIVEFDDSLGLLIGGGMATINTNLVNRLIPVLKGFTLSVVSLVKVNSGSIVFTIVFPGCIF